MVEPISILILEDNPDDAELMLYELHQAGFDPTWQLVCTEPEYLTALQQAGDLTLPLDVILADYTLPHFNALRALHLLQERELEIPFLVVTGSISEEVAVECMKQGAADYLLKNHLRRLGLAVTRALGQKQLREAKRQVEEKYRSIFENTVEGIFQLTPEGQLLTANPALARMWGYASVEELLASSSSGVELQIQPDHWAEFRQQMEQYGVVCGFEVQSRRRDGSPIWISCNARTVPTAGQILYYEGTVEDITERKRAEQERERLIEELNTFAHTVAHDLKNPLFVLTATTQVLEADWAKMSPADLNRCLQTIVRMGHKMNNIIDGLLLLAGVRHQEIELQPLDMASIITEAQHRLSHLIASSQAEITGPTTWPVVMGYAPWVEEVWVNYLSNGLKYGGQPPQLEMGATAAENGQVCFWVRDNGAGLTPTERARLFTPFTRLNQVQTQGHGLGLSIARRIVEKLGGQVGVESNGMAGQGSVFRFTLPGAGQAIE